MPGAQDARKFPRAMLVMEADGRPTGRQAPRELPSSGDYLGETLTHGIDTYEVSYTSAHAWSRKFLERVLPLPEDGLLGLDGYLTAVDRLFGPLEFIHQPVARYRRHDHNKGPDGFRFEPSYLEKRLDRKYARIDYAEGWVKALGYEVDWYQFRRLRDWRLALMQHVLMLWGRQHDTLPFLEFVTAPFQRHRPSMATSMLLSVSLAAVRAAPRPLAIRIARELLLRSQQRRATFTASEQQAWRAAGAR